MSYTFIHGVGVPPEIIAGLITLALALCAGGALIVRAVSRSFANHLDLAAKRQQSEFQKDQEKWQVELENLKRESITTAAAYQFVLSAANKLSDRVDTQDKTIAALQEAKEHAQRQLETAQIASKKRDEQIGELQALLSKTASERDQERIQRETLEKQRNEALAQVEAMKQKIADLETKAAQLDKLLLRVDELERHQTERHDAINKLQQKIADIELARMTAEKERDELKAELDIERRKSQQIPTPVMPAEDKAITSGDPVEPKRSDEVKS